MREERHVCKFGYYLPVVDLKTTMGSHRNVPAQSHLTVSKINTVSVIVIFSGSLFVEKLKAGGLAFASCVAGTNAIQLLSVKKFNQIILKYGIPKRAGETPLNSDIPVTRGRRGHHA